MAKVSRNNSNHLLALLPADDYALLEKYLKQVSLPAGELLEEPGQPIEHVFFPLAGMVSILTVMKDGSAIEVATIGSEGVIGAVAALGTRIAISRAVVQLEVTAKRMSRANFLRCTKESPAIRNLVQRSHEALIGQIQQTAACNALHPVEARLARWLLQSHDRTHGDHVLLTQEFLSEMLAVRRASVSEVAKALQGKGLIKYRRGNIEILDRARLEGKACECYGVVAKQTRKLLAKSFD